MHKLIAALLLITSVSFTEQAQEPEQLQSLRSSWQRARDQATDPIDDKYRAALRQMMELFTKSGDLTNALAVKNELEKISPNAVPLPNASRTKPIRYRYEFVADKMTYEQASERAKASGGIVACPVDDGDLDEIFKIAAQNGAPQILLGATRAPGIDSDWTCSDGTNLDKRFAKKIRLLDDISRTSLRLGDGPTMNANDSNTPLPFLIAVPK